MIIDNNLNRRVSETGSALVYILIAIALLAALTASFMRPSSQQTTAQGAFNASQELNSQIEFIRSSIQECVLVYDGGDRSSTPFVPLENAPWPINPSSSHYDTPPANPASDDKLSGLRCPGNPGNSNDHVGIWGGASGKFLPPPPNLFEEWEYYNGTDGVFFFIRTDKTDAFLQTALTKLDEEYSECQADVIDASSAEVELTSTAGADDPECADGETCFRVWMVIRGSAVYNGDTDGEEAACP